MKRLNVGTKEVSKKKAKSSKSLLKPSKPNARITLKKPAKSSVEMARNIITGAVSNIADKHGFAYNRIAIRNQKTRLGSCSSKKNLNFNWQIIKFPKSIMEYIIKHELAHLKQPNHSTNYWREVEKIDPLYRKHHEWVKENAHKYITI